MLFAFLHPIAAVVAGRAIAATIAVLLQHLFEELRACARDHRGLAHRLGRRRRRPGRMGGTVDAMAVRVVDEGLLLDYALLAAQR